MSFKTKKDTPIDKDAKGINLESLKRSTAIRSKFLNKFGQMPQSILNFDRADAKKRIDIVCDEMGGGAAGYQKKMAKDLVGKGVNRDLSERFKIQGRNIAKFGGVMSAFPQNIGRIVVDFYCPPGGLIYDPFAGHNSRMELVFKSGRDYTGVDISKKFMEANRKIKDILIDQKTRGFGLKGEPNKIELIEGSSAKVDLPDNYGDFTLSSPPYYDIEFYGDEPEQLGLQPTYNDFLDKITENIEETYRILKPGAFICWFVNDFRKNKIFHPYHIDSYEIMVDAGFEPFSVYVVDLGWPVNGAFVRDVLQWRLFPKRHEYCIVMRKPKENPEELDWWNDPDGPYYWENMI